MKTYNHFIPQRALNHLSPFSSKPAIKRPELFKVAFTNRRDLTTTASMASPSPCPPRQRTDLRALALKLASQEASSRPLPVCFSEVQCRRFERYQWPGTLPVVDVIALPSPCWTTTKP